MQLCYIAWGVDYDYPVDPCRLQFSFHFKSLDFINVGMKQNQKTEL